MVAIGKLFCRDGSSIKFTRMFSLSLVPSPRLGTRLVFSVLIAECCFLLSCRCGRFYSHGPKVILCLPISSSLSGYIGCLLPPDSADIQKKIRVRQEER